MTPSHQERTFFLDFARAPSPEEKGWVVSRYLEKGGNPNAYLSGSFGFKSVLGVCCEEGVEKSVDQLLAAGALPHWPLRSRVGEVSLYGDDDEVVDEDYDGPKLDPLGVVLDAIGDLLTDDDLLDDDAPPLPPLSEQAEGLMGCFKHLLAAGADPAQDDPVYLQKPFDGLMAHVSENYGPLNDASPRDRDAKAILVEITWQLTKATGALKSVAAGKWKKLPFSDGYWLNDYPSITKPLVALAEKELLDAGVVKVKSGRAPRRI